MLKNTEPEFTKAPSSSVVIKVGGNELDDEKFLSNLSHVVQELRSQKLNVVIVHGGGRKIEELQRSLSIPVQKVQGLRVTCDQTMEVVRMALIGITGPQIVCSLRANGVSACCLNASGGIGSFENSMLVGKRTNQELELGWVGEIVKVNTKLIDATLNLGMVPVIAPLALCFENEKLHWLNVNADSAACAVAVAIQAMEFIMFTNVDGLQIKGAVLQNVPFEKINSLLNHDEVSGGMIPKLKAAQSALKSGVKRVGFGSLSSFQQGRHTEFSK